MLIGLVDRLTRRMRSSDREGRTVVLRLRFADYSAATRSRTLRRATSAPVLAAARALLAESRPLIAARGLTLVDVTVAGLDGDGHSGQLSLPLDDPAGAALDVALGTVRDRFGPGAITRGSLIGRDPGLAAWMAPEPGAGAGERGGRDSPRRAPGSWGP